MDRKRTILSLLLIASLLLSLAVPGFAQGKVKRFRDVDVNHWSYDAVNQMSELGILNGYEDGTFRPDQAVTREQFAKMMVTSLKLKLVKPSQATFDDVNRQYWAFGFVETAKPYLTGYQSSGHLYFKPQADAVREDMAVALVKALGYTDEKVDPDTLDAFEDSDEISPNLEDYVAIAVQKKLMKGAAKGNRLYFNPQASLTRAEAAVLLKNVMDEEKIVFGEEEKVVLDPEADPEDDSSDATVPEVTGKVTEEGVLLQWDPIDDADFQGYKVVVSSTDATPSYPDNGYFRYITDPDTDSAEIQVGDTFSNGSGQETVKAEKAYYFTITALYGDRKVTGNVVRLTMPEAEPPEPAGYAASKISGRVTADGIRLEWTEIDDARFQGYKVVVSSSDATPVYPENGYYKYITDPEDTDVTLKAGQTFSNGSGTETLKSGRTYYFSITVLYDGKKVPGNVIRLTLP